MTEYTEEQVAAAREYALGKKGPARKPAGEAIEPGHNSGQVEHAKLKSYIERIERLEEEKAGLAADVRDVFAEAKSNGFDTKTMRQVLKLRRIAANERIEQEYMLELYKRALGMESTMEDGDE